MSQRRVSCAAHTAFSAMHPSVPACYLVITLVLTMAAMQPVLIALSLAGGLVYGCCARGVRETLRGLRWQLPFVVLVALVNPLFSASGSTELFRMGARAVYLESLAFGCAMGGLFVAAALWFSAGTRLCPFDKVMALAGNASPVVALMVSMTMRLIPRFVRRGRQIATAQAVNARALRATDGLRDRLQLTTTLMDWGMEDSLETADAMRARGWGAARRTTYTRYRFCPSDALALTGLISAGVILGVLAWSATAQYAFYPTMSELVAWWGYAPYAAWMLMPAALHVREERRFR